MSLPRPDRSPARKPGVTIKDIARELGLSFQAVSQALNPRNRNTSQVSKATQERILETAAKMGYRSHPAARALRSGRTGLLGVLIFDHPQQMMHHRLHHVLEAIHTAGYQPFVHLAPAEPDGGAMEGCLTMLDARVEGVLLVDPIGFPGEEPVLELLQQRVPVVSLGSHQWSCVTSYQADRRQGYGDLTRHLIDAGCRSLTLLCSEASEQVESFFERFMNDMISGFEQAAAERGGIVTRLHRVATSGAGSEVHPIHQPGYVGMREIIASGAVPGALLCQADSWAQGALRACYEAGIRVPEDLLLTGFNDEPSSSAGWPPLTTVVQPYARIAQQGVEHVISQIRGERENKPGAIVTLPGQLVVRASSVRKPMSPSDTRRPA